MDYFDNLNVSRKELEAILKEMDFKCNAAARQEIASKVKVIKPRKVQSGRETIYYAEKVGGLEPGTSFEYPNAQGGISTARVCGLYNLPKDMVNPYLYCFGGVMTAPFYAMEILRFYAKQTGELLPFVSSGKEGNKGLFKKVFNRTTGVIKSTEYDAYFNIMTYLCGKDYAYANYETSNDTDTEGNLVEMYQFAQRRGLKEMTLVLCTGNPFYDKRLLAEWMWQLKQDKFADVRINLVCVHCPVFLAPEKSIRSHYLPEAKISEIYLGYIAACLGPLLKDTITFDGATASPKPERYLIPHVYKYDWEQFKDIIVNYSNMGWPNYQEILYDISHEEAVMNVILSDLFARESFTPLDYDYGIINHLRRHQNFLGGQKGEDLLKYLLTTNEKKFFN